MTRLSPRTLLALAVALVALAAVPGVVVAAAGSASPGAATPGPHGFTFAGARAAAASSLRSPLLKPDPTRAPGADQPNQPQVVVLSDERRRTVWANEEEDAPVYDHASAASKRIARLHYWTQDGFPEVYLVLRAYRTKAGEWWLRVRLPQRPNGMQGWVRRDALGPLRQLHTLLVVDRHALRATFFVNGRRVWRAPVGVGKRSTPTPGGHFWIREGFPVGGHTLYGPYAFGTSAYSVLSDWPGGGVVGIHGTDQPRLIPGRPSHGCVRMRNPDVTWLSRHLPIGTPVRIL